MADDIPASDWERRAADGREAERAAILGKAQLVAERILDALGKGANVEYELALVERAWQNALAQLPAAVPHPPREAVGFVSNLVDGLEPETIFDLVYDALAALIRRCTTWVLEASGMDPMVRDELVVIENRYSALLMLGLDTPVSLAGVKLSRTGAQIAAPGSSSDHDPGRHGPQELARRAVEAVAALEAMEVELLAQHPESEDWAFHVLGETVDELRGWLRWYQQRPSAS